MTRNVLPAPTLETRALDAYRHWRQLQDPFDQGTQHSDYAHMRESEYVTLLHIRHRRWVMAAEKWATAANGLRERA